ncbi:hypothetical protein pb186bvf_011654 [Paramecium bursaria]
MIDRSLYYDDIRGICARTKFLHPQKNHNFPYGDAYSQQDVQFGRNLYQNQMLQIPDQIAPQGLAYFRPGGRKHFGVQRGEIEQFRALQNLYDPPRIFGANYDRSLSTKDIEGAVTNTLISKVVKNKEAAIAQRSGSQGISEKAKSLWEPKLQEINEPDYQPRLNQKINEPTEEQRLKYLEQLRKENEQLVQEKLKSHTSENYRAENQYHTLQPESTKFQQQGSTQSLNQRVSSRQQISEDARQYQYQKEMEKQWQQQQQEQNYRQQLLDQQKQQEQISQQQQQVLAQQEYELSKRREEDKKRQYALELQQQQSDLRSRHDTQKQQQFSKSQIIGHTLNQQLYHDSLQQQMKEIEDKRKQNFPPINRYQNHELQQYLYDLKNGKVGQQKPRNTPTFMSYAGSVLQQ